MALYPASPRHLLLAALLALLLLPLLGWWWGALRTFAAIGMVLASVWLVMAGAGILRQWGRGDV